MQCRPSRTQQDPYEQARRDVLRYRGLRRLEIQKAEPRMRGFRGMLLLFTLFLFANTLWHWHILSDRGINLFGYVTSVVFIVYVFCLAGNADLTPSFWDAGRARRRYQNGLDVLIHAYDIRAVGPLAEAFWLRPIPSGVAGALTRLLRIQAQTLQTALLSDRQRQCLLRILTLRGDTETPLQIALLDSLAASSQTRALPAVLKLAHDTACPPILQTAAQICLLALQARATETSQRQTLLRPPHIPPAELLRPTFSPPEETSDLLLRASVGSDTRP